MFLSILASVVNFNVHESKIGTQKKRKIRMIEVVSINVKRPHALLECKEMLIRNVSRDQYFVQS